MPGMNVKDTTVAAVRTGWNGAVAAALVYGASKVFEVTLDTSDPLIIAASAPVLGVINRLSNVVFDVLKKNKVVGFVLFGISRTPTYAPKD